MTFFCRRPGFSDCALFTVIKCHIPPFLHKKNHYFRKEFLHKTIFYSVHPFARIRQHYFSKYWGDHAMHGPSPTGPPQIFFGDRPPQSPQVSAPAYNGNWLIASLVEDQSFKLPLRLSWLCLA